MTTETIDFNSSVFHADPYAVYARLRARPEPTYLARLNTWLFTRYDDVAAMLKDPRLTKQIARPAAPPIEMSMLFQDPPAHQRLRNLVNQAFTRGQVQALEARITRIADNLIDAVEPAGQMDFIAQFALLLPVMVISEMLGVPEEDREKFQYWSNKYMAATGVTATMETMRDQEAAMMALAAFFTDLIERRRSAPQADILSALTQAHDLGDRLTTQELIGTVTLLLVAGHETTVNLLGNGLLCLLNNPDQFALLQQQPALLDSAIEEMLRYESPVQRGTFRIAVEPITLRTTTIKPGAQIWAFIGAANRDPEQFIDPDRFDITRVSNKHLAFGYGIHYCLGASLARTEARIGFVRVLARLPGLYQIAELPAVEPQRPLHRLKSVGVDDTLPQSPLPQWQPHPMMRGLKSLPVRW
jgi:cytochrome P450